MDRTDHCVAAREDTAGTGTVTERNHDFGRWRRFVRAPQGDFHVARDRPGDQQHVGMARRRHEVHPESFHVVDGAGQAVDFDLAAVTGSGVDLANRERATEQPPDARFERHGDRGNRRIGKAQRLGCESRPPDFREQLHRA